MDGTPGDPGSVKLAIGVPLSWTHAPADFTFSLQMLKKPPGTEIVRASSGPIDEMRNLIVLRALEMDCTHVLFLDADMTFPEDTIFRLLSHGLPIVGGLMFKRRPPFDPLVMVGERHRLQVLYDYKPGLNRVTATGTGCLLIDSRVFDDVPYPWFRFGTTDDGAPIGEDVGFCYAAQDAGYPIYVDADVKTEHLTTLRVGEDTHKIFRALASKGLDLFGSA